MRLLPTLLLGAAACLHAEVKLTIGDIIDHRTAGKLFDSVEVQLKIVGPELAECKGVRVAIDAVDDSGKLLKLEETVFNRREFRPPNHPFNHDDPNEYEVRVEFDNPPRFAKAIKSISGTIEILLPTKDPASIITAKLAKDAGRPLVHEALKTAGIRLTLLASKGSEFRYTLFDPNSKLAAVEFYSSKGKLVKAESRMTSEDETGRKSIRLALDNPIAPGVVAKFYLHTEKSVLSIPVAFSDLPLP